MLDQLKGLLGGKKKRDHDPALEEQEASEAAPAEEEEIAAMNGQQINAAMAQAPESNPVSADTALADGEDRTVEGDATQIQEQIAKIPEKIFRDMKKAAMANPKVKQQVKQAKLRFDFYGSRIHKEYGATVETLTGGRITAEEAMRMNPSGGIAGAGLIGIAFDFGPLHRHAIWHDACGFLRTAFNVGPGYGGDDSDSPLSGQFEGIGREMNQDANIPDWKPVGAPTHE